MKSYLPFNIQDAYDWNLLKLFTKCFVIFARYVDQESIWNTFYDERSGSEWKTDSKLSAWQRKAPWIQNSEMHNPLNVPI